MPPIIPEDHALLKDASVGVAIVDSVSGTILTANAAYCSLIGRERERVVGNTWMRFTHLDDVAHGVYAIYKMHETKSPWSFARKRYIGGDGEIVHVDVVVAPVGYGDAELTHVVIVRGAASDGSIADLASLVPGIDAFARDS